MKRFRSMVMLATLATSAFAVSAFAQTEKFDIDPAHSQVGFSVRHFFSRVPGKFKDLSGVIQYDAKNLAASSVEVIIAANSIDTGNDRRDADLRSPNFFDVEKFPALTFKSTKIEPGKDGKFKIEGDLTMHGVTKKVVLDATTLGMGPVAMGGNSMGVRGGWEATTIIDRKDYGIVWNRTLDQGGTMLGDDVTITLLIEAKKAAPAAAEAKK